MLLKHRRLFFNDEVNQESVNEAIRKLWYMELSEPGKPITVVINSPGGSVDAGFALWDQLKMVSSPISTLVTGFAASMGSVLSLCADRGRRFATPNARVMIHQPAVHGAVRGPASDLEIHAREILNTRERIIDIYVEATGKDRDTVAQAIERDRFFSASEAKAYGLLDEIVTSFDQLP
ncbi:MAG: ATP-dependent Clp protease proteolytic subunit [Gammaproteobacteria bacterium]|nr:ATP-dependent Clp protease proteolytic subunit [Gammaproteobacteria bacterium]